MESSYIEDARLTRTAKQDAGSASPAMRTLRDLVKTARSHLARSPLRPKSWVRSVKAAKLLWFGYGHLRSVRTRSSVDANGQPIPWYTYPAIEFLQQLDLSDRTVFEYGSGNSTRFWAARAARVVTVEDDEHWWEKLRAELPRNCVLLLEQDLREFANSIHRYPEGFDIVVVDGPARGRTRLKCAAAAVQRLKPGGMIILDNSDWLPESAALLRNADLLQVDMSGFFPIGDHTQTTSLFFHRECRFRTRNPRQPAPSVGAVLWDWETVVPVDGHSLIWDGEPLYGVMRQEVLDKVTPTGIRRFEVAFLDRPDHPPESTRLTVIYDHARERILMAYVIAPAHAAIEAEVRRLRAMSWEAFRRFARQSDTRRYLLD